MSPKFTKFLIIAWLILLVPWFIYAPWAGLAYDAGVTFQVNLLVWSLWTYPISVVIAALFRERVPIMTLFPCLNIVVWFIASRL